ARRTFEIRHATIASFRRTLDEHGFIEVETPVLHVEPGGAHARPFVTHHNTLDMTMYLRIALELHLKRLIVGGMERVYEIGRVFRNEGLSTRHNPEFTMMELYWAYADYRDLMDLTEQLVIALVDVVKPGARRLGYQGRDHDLATPFRRVTMADAIVECNPGIDAARLRDVDYLRSWCTGLGAKYDKGDGAGKLQVAIFDHTVEQHLLEPTFIHAYPAEVSPLARANDVDPFVTDRFEFFLSGREMANGFSELNDPEDQAARFHAQVMRKDAGDDEAMFYDADYIRALEYGMPPTAGLGIGVDRLVMFLTDQAAIRDVLLFPQVRPEGG
ncbi:MAG TPA: lysine--tRNA ligase, partial [Steroidobacteraceae bacterium]|nr:lysine--tRNA ligase [Steroidobacteraceae bacterium]